MRNVCIEPTRAKPVNQIRGGDIRIRIRQCILDMNNVCIARRRDGAKANDIAMCRNVSIVVRVIIRESNKLRFAGIHICRGKRDIRERAALYETIGISYTIIRNTLQIRNTKRPGTIGDQRIFR